MKIINTLKITKLRSKKSISEFNNVIYGVDYYLVCGILEYADQVYISSGTINLDISSLNVNSFVSVDNISQELVVSWLLALENIDTVDNLSFVKYANETLMFNFNLSKEESDINVDWDVIIPES